MTNQKERAKRPNFTRFPNIFLDQHMKELTNAQFKVLAAIVRLTEGYHRKKTNASLTIIQEMTGLSRQGVINVASALEKPPWNLIKRTQIQGQSTEWELLFDDDQLVNSVDQGSQLSLPADSDTSQLSRPPTYTRDLLKKKEVKKKKGELVFPTSLDIPVFKEVWEEWEEHRKQIRKKLTPLAIERQLKKLSSVPVSVAIAMLNRSIENGWTGIFDLPKEDPAWHEVVDDGEQLTAFEWYAQFQE